VDEPIVIGAIIMIAMVLAWREVRFQREEEQDRLRARERMD